MKSRSFRITKKIAKHGSQAIIVIPKALQKELSFDTIVDLDIKIIKKPEEENEFI